MRVFKHCIAYYMLFLASTGLSASNPKRPWTFFVYIAADNNLNPEADMNIAQMVKASSTKNAYIVVHLNIKRDNEAKKTQKFLIQNGKMIQIGATTREDSGDYNTLLNAMKWALTDYPSDHVAVDVWNHGSGPLNRNPWIHRGVCYDDSTGNYMTDVQYKKAFDVIVNQYRGGKKIDIIAFDACLMATIEVAYTLQKYATFLVASQETVPGPGYNYTDVLSIFAHSNPDPVTFARWIVSAYDHQYKPTRESYTLAAIDLTKIGNAVSAVNTIAQTLAKYLPSNTKLSDVIATCADPSQCPHFDEPTYIDLYSFLANLYTHVTQMGLSNTDAPKVKATIKNGLTTLAQTMISNVYSPNFGKTRGLSIYFADYGAGIEPSYQDLYWTKNNPQWIDFLSAYLE